MIRKTPMWRRYLTFWGRNSRRDVNDEIDFHLEMRGREFAEKGMTENIVLAALGEQPVSSSDTEVSR